MKRWWKYIKPYKKHFILGPLCMIVEVVGEVVMPKLMSVILNIGTAFKGVPMAIEELGANISDTAFIADKLTSLQTYVNSLTGVKANPELVSSFNALNDSFGAGNGISQELLNGVMSAFNAYSPGTFTGFIIFLSAMTVLIAVLMMAGGIGGAYFGGKAAVNFATDLRADIYGRVQNFSFANIDRFSSSSLVTRLTNDVTQMQNMINMILRMCLRAPGMMIGGLVMAIVLKPSLSVVLAVTIPLMVLSLAFVVKTGFTRFKTVQKKIDGLNATVQENITNVRVVKSFVREDEEIGKFRKSNADLKHAGLSATKVMIFISPVMTLFMNITTITVLLIGGKMVISGGMPVGDLSAFVTYITQILMSLMMVTFMVMMSSRAMASAKRISEVLDEVPDIDDKNAAHPELEVKNGKIEFRDVTFRYYKNSPDTVLDSISLTVNPGETVGIIGSTGCGKTTLVSMIPRLYDTDKGQILIDGVDVRDYSLFNLREGVGMVLQKNVLFSGTIEENLKWGNPEATEEEITSAAESAQADKFVRNFTNGYDTALGQGGTNVSGGQKQRLCIARALLKKPKIIILDDSTSAVDTATEAMIRKAFANELKDSTKIIIAQRIMSVMDADRIIVMNDGKITGQGTHGELLKSNIEYQEIYNSQMERYSREGGASNE